MFGQTIKAANVTFTTIDFPDEAITNIHGINTAGDMVGNYAAATNLPSHGFLYSNGTFTTLDYPTGDATLAIGINDSNVISGWALTNQSTGAAGFLYDGTKFTTIHAPGQSATIVYGINNAGIVVGGDGSLAATTGFELVGKRFHTVMPPGSFCSVDAAGINNLGEVVGFTCGGLGNNNGFVLKNGHYRTIDVPGSNDLTQALGINDSDIVVGWYEKCSPCADHGFALINGKYVSIDYPGALETYAVGINSLGQVVGSYTFDQQTYHGFVTGTITEADFQ